MIASHNIKTPKRFSFTIDKIKCSRIIISLIDKKTQHSIGYLTLRQKNNWYLTHSYLSEKFRGQGLGNLLYSKAIHYCHQRGYKVRSADNTSDMAQRAWNGKSLNRLFKIKRKILTNKDCGCCFIRRWYAYPKS